MLSKNVALAYGLALCDAGSARIDVEQVAVAELLDATRIYTLMALDLASAEHPDDR